MSCLWEAAEGLTCSFEALIKQEAAHIIIESSIQTPFAIKCLQAEPALKSFSSTAESQPLGELVRTVMHEYAC